jgi:hypothetical protein
MHLGAVSFDVYLPLRRFQENRQTSSEASQSRIGGGVPAPDGSRRYASAGVPVTTSGFVIPYINEVFGSTVEDLDASFGP